ncbi:MAG: ATP-dependent RNA helicase HrpA, partial [Phycisphaerae bacterium]
MHDGHPKPRPPRPPVPAFNAAWLENLRPRLTHTLLRDRRRLTQWLDTLLNSARTGRPMVPQMQRLEESIRKSANQADLRRQHLPKPSYPSDLPVVARREEIARAIAENQVVVICGQTGSGKTTQIPKICLELGRGIHGLIGHTQPRRLAARTVAARIAQELRTPLGHAVGFKVRFDEQTRPQTYIKLMTDGILLAETQGDRLLEQYDTLIIDEAHERSLNIDFLLGYLKQLLPQRPDLKIIITSATIDPERFAQHFATAGQPGVPMISGSGANTLIGSSVWPAGHDADEGGGIGTTLKPAPIIEVSGRTYAVETRYRPILTEEDDEEDPNILGAIVDAVRELTEGEGGSGDILIFLSGEREIRLTAEALTQASFRHTEILPLYARLSVEEQTRIFAPHGKRRLVLATNVAETSLTVPGIKYVIDPGFARISRYSAKTKVQRLPIEKVSQASAEQRKGRCGRTSPGICIRLYSEEDFLARPAFTEPEILRTNLASVILQMKALHLGEIDQFPFLEPPDGRQIRDGYQTLFELNAITAPPEQVLTPLGRQLARLPIDPRIGRMILAAAAEGGEHILEPVLIIAAALSVQDPRLRPMDAQTQADEAHQQFRDPTSDFLSFLKLWEWFTRSAKHHSLGQLRKLCIEKYISYIHMREWQDIHRQLKELA